MSAHFLADHAHHADLDDCPLRSRADKATGPESFVPMVAHVRAMAARTPMVVSIRRSERLWSRRCTLQRWAPALNTA